VGCGRWGRYILRDLVSLGCTVAVVARSAESRHRAAAGGASVVVPDVEHLPSVAGVVIAVPATSHASVILQVVPRAVPIFVEKPLCTDPADAARILALAARQVYVMDKWRYHPGVEALAAVARAGDLGAPLGLHTQRLGWGKPHVDVDAVWHLVPHELAIALEVLGMIPPARHAVAEIVEAQAVGFTGVLGDRPWQVCEVSNRSPDHRRTVRLHCEAGAAVLRDSYSDHVEIVRARAADIASAPLIERRAIDTEWPLLRELRAFVEHLSGGPPPRSSAEEGAAVVNTIADLRRLAGLEVAPPRTSPGAR
jgi:predicted dehydrogenase